jgi:hypothetical protein
MSDEPQKKAFQDLSLAEVKGMAYDEIRKIEQAKYTLQQIEKRVIELEQKAAAPFRPQVSG